jgi:hypothetical protein
MYAVILFFLVTLAHADENYKALFTEFCFNCSISQNKQITAISLKANLNEDKTIKPIKIILADKSYPVLDASDVPNNQPLKLYSIDLNKDGHLDLAFKHIVALKNVYMMYFLYDDKTTKYTYLGSFPELLFNDSKELISFETSGTETVEKKYYFKDNKLFAK